MVWWKSDTSGTLYVRPRSREGLVTSSAGSLVDDGARILKFIMWGFKRMACSLTKTDTSAGIMLSGLEWDQAESSEVDGSHKGCSGSSIKNESIFKQCMETPGQSHSKERNGPLIHET